ncbi:glycoside hydrolase family 15 protein [Corallococcus macrosporus]|uniref:Glycoside hydrolase 15-related protein n=1 Tax=Myxococcus fulvus (strain ATCC BAA-855 / HW-1) TaxID=483219 RepID=F8CPF6_MYXFH|nr:glycoside hydrolase family 15 protein [Corallococcus macrosporus]AEI67918.1 glycoside hydrolase 15-related protein [Corallococcus macrosporus]
MRERGGWPGRADDLALKHYALIGDGATAALVAVDGAIDWLCLGRFDGPAVFCRLLDARLGGCFQLAPEGAFHAAHHYLGDTNVLVTEFESDAGRLRLTDFMPLRDAGRPSAVWRKLEGLSGEVPVRLVFAPTFDFARADARMALRPGGCSARSGQHEVRVRFPAPMALEPWGASARLTVSAGRVYWARLSLSPEDGEPGGDEETVLRKTLGAWERWSSRGNYPGAFAGLLRRSALALKLLIHAPSGGMVAAPTTSLPESPGGVRNWDYRFTWLRDASWVINALMGLGYHDESMAYIGWLEHLSRGRDWPAVLYALDGRAPDQEVTLGHLQGYLGSRPVRLGNTVASQVQHDVFGEVVSAIHLCSEGMPSMRPLREGLWRLVAGLAERAATQWREPGRGLWEVRDRARCFTSSRLMCWLALDRAVRMARRDGLPGPLERWALERERLRRAILEEGYDARQGAFVRAVGDTELDASALLLPRTGFLPADDARMVSTVARIRERLEGRGGLVRRYACADGLPGQEGAFTACSFWLVECLALQGRRDEAHALFERVVRHAGGVGLLSEELGLARGELLGNHPQALSHLALVHAALALAGTE